MKLVREHINEQYTKIYSVPGVGNPRPGRSILIDPCTGKKLNEKFQEESDPIADLGIGGFSLSQEIHDLIKKFNIMNIHDMVDDPKIIKYWKDTLENALLGRRVTGVFARGNEDFWGTFNRLTTPKVKRIHLFVEDPLTQDNMAVLDFALIVDDPGAWVRNPEGTDHYLKNADETWYYYSFGDLGRIKDYTPKQKYTLYLK